MSAADTSRKPGLLIFVSAAEPSADLHGAALIRATRATCPSARFVGVAGPRMVEAGCESIFDMTRHAGMLLGAVGAVGKAIAMLKTSERHLRRYPFDAAVLIDSPTLHLPLAAKAQAVGVPVLYYIAPQLWAWGAHRIYQLRHRVDRVAAILPFEEEYFRRQGVNATYVGHPLADRWADTTIDQNAVAQIRSHGDPVVALLPGSRKHVVKSVLPGQLEVARHIVAAIPGASAAVSAANAQVTPTVRSAIQGRTPEIRLYTSQYAELIQAADLVLVASGTAALEVAFHRKPMIVMYNASRVFYHLVARWLIRTKHLSLPNILAGRKIVPEFMPYFTATRPIAERAIELLRSDDARERMVHDLDEMVSPLTKSRASRRTAELLLDMISGTRR